MKKPVPAEVFYSGFLGDVVKQLLGPESEADPAALMATALAYFSHSIGPKPRVVNGEIDHPLTIWAAIIGDSSIGKKGESNRAVNKLFYRAMPMFYDRREPFFEDGYPISGASLVATIADAEAAACMEGDGGEEPKWPAPTGFPIFFKEEELAAALRAMSGDKRLSTQTRKLWEGDYLQHNTKQGKKVVRIILDQPKGIILGHATPEEFQSTLSDDDLKGGSVNRFMFCASQSTKQLPHGGNMDPAKLDKAANMLQRYIGRGFQHGEIRMTPEAAKYWVKCYAEIESMIGPGTGMAVWIGRAKPYALRISAIYALLGTPLKDDAGRDIRRVSIRVQDLKAAMAWIRYSAATCLWMMGPGAAGGRSALATKIYNILAVSGPQTGSDLAEKLSGRVSATKRDGAILELGDAVKVWVNPIPGRGRRGFVFGLSKDYKPEWELVDLSDGAPEGEQPDPTTLRGEVVEDATVARRRPTAARSERAAEPQSEPKPRLRVVQGTVTGKATKAPTRAPRPVQEDEDDEREKFVW